MKRVVQISLPSTGEEEWQACREPLMSGWLTQGPKVAAFEDDRPPIVVPPTVLVQRPPEAWGEGR